MPVLRLPRPEASETASSPSPQRPARGVELDGFESEDGASVSGSPARPGGRRRRWLTALLAALVMLEAVPTALWARDYFNTVYGGVTSPAPGPPPELVLSAVAQPCEALVTPVSESAVPPATPTKTAARAILPTATPPAAQGIAAGLLSIVAPLPLHVYARGRLLGTSEVDALMLPLGAHELELVNESVGYRVVRSVTIQSGRQASLRIDPPQGTLNVNAVPWAEVWIDNQRVGETPIGNVQVPIGTREIVFRHPELGERRTRVLVTMKQPARVSVDLRKP